MTSSLNSLTVNGIGQTCFSGRAYSSYHPSTETSRALAGFEPKIEPQLSTRDTRFTSAPPPPLMKALHFLQPARQPAGSVIRLYRYTLSKLFSSPNTVAVCKQCFPQRIYQGARFLASFSLMWSLPIFVSALVNS